MKCYATPRITVAGSVRSLTAQGGGADQTDVPLGTSSGGNLGDVTGFQGS